MFSTKCKKFKGEIENYLRNRQNQFKSKIDRLFVSLRLKTCLRRANIIKKDGYPASHLFFVMFMLPLLRLDTIHWFCRKGWRQWSAGGKDTFGKQGRCYIVDSLRGTATPIQKKSR